ncbi:MAG: LacI family transcriptional regulator [Clostridiales bacterium]|nr:LacI family transcriptional regulator [Clostridiales bacterium]
MTTIADVARQAGVSMMTVSRVINKSGRVSEETRKRVQDAIERLGYRANMVARGLATGRNHLIAYVVSNIGNPFFSNVSMGIEKACVGRGYSVIVYDVSSEKSMLECVDMLIGRQLDGVVFHHLNITREQVQHLASGGVRCVTIDNEETLPETVSVDTDNYAGARMAARHLIEKGHRRIGCIRGLIDPGLKNGAAEYIETFQRRIWRDRTNGFLDELREKGLEPTCMHEGSGGTRTGFASGRELLIRILDMPDPPTAIYCENDLIALGALGECLERKTPVPEQLAIVGHDGLDFCVYLYPRVTTVRQPQYEIGLLAAEKLLDCIETDRAAEHIVTQSSLFIGDTT